MKEFIGVALIVGLCAYIVANIVKFVRKVIDNKKRKEKLKEMEKHENENSKDNQSQE